MRPSGRCTISRTQHSGSPNSIAISIPVGAYIVIEVVQGIGSHTPPTSGTNALLSFVDLVSVGNSPSSQRFNSNRWGKRLNMSRRSMSCFHCIQLSFSVSRLKEIYDFALMLSPSHLKYLEALRI